jgi:hypothetical protein
MGKRIVRLTESDLERIIRKIIKEGSFEGASKGLIQYTTSDNKTVCYKLTHDLGRFLPTITLNVDEFNVHTKEFVLSHSYSTENIEGVISDKKMRIITYNMDRGTTSFEIPMGKDGKMVTFSKVSCK